MYPPTLPYSGLTIILDKPSRFDVNRDGSIKRLISGNAGDYFDKLLTPFTRYNCDIRLASTYNSNPLLPNTRVILALGQASLDLFKPNSGLGTFRGSPIIIDNKVIIPTLTPQDSHDRRNYENPQNAEDEEKEDKESEKDFQKTSRKNFRFWFHADIKKAIRICREGIAEYPKVKINLAPSPSLLVEKLREFENCYLVLDIETDAAQNLTCFSFLFSPTKIIDPAKTYEVFVVPFKRYNGNLFYSQLDYCNIFRFLTLSFAKNTVVGHNLAFDLFILLFKYRINCPLRIYDTMLAHHRCHPEIEKSLGHCVSYYTDLPYHKDEGIFDPKTDEQESKLWSYNAKDVITTFFVMSEQQKEIAKLKASDSVEQACTSQRSLLMMQYEGCLCDTDKLCKIVDTADEKFLQYKRILKLLTQREFNPRSGDQVSEYFYDTLKLPEPLKNPTKEDNLLKLYAKYQIPSLRVVLAARGEGKEASSLRRLILWKGNRLTCQYKLAGQEMFRPSSTALLGFKGNKKNGTKKVRGFGTNMQNWSKRIRPVIIAPPGYVLFQTDQAGADALIVAYLCQMGRFRSLFINKIKPHTFVAMHIAAPVWAEKLGLPDIEDYLNSPIIDLKKLKYWNDLSKLIADSDGESNPQKRYYYIGKTMCHLLNYDAKAPQFQLSALIKSEGSLAFTATQAAYYRNLYRDKLFPEITNFHCDIVRELDSQDRILCNLFGYPRKFNEIWGRELFKQAYCYKPQSTVAIITLKAGTEITERMDSNEPLLEGLSILQNGFDSLLFSCPEEKWKEVATSLTPHMERKLVNHRNEEFKMGSGLSVGKNWGGYDSIKNPLGLREFNLEKNDYK